MRDHLTQSKKIKHIPSFVFFILSTALLMQGCTLFSDDTFDGGNGTETNPYQISTIDQLQAIDDEEYLNKHFIQTGDIDASPSAEFQDGSGFRRIGTQKAPFTGSYNGNGYAIKDLKINFNKVDRNNGLFGYIKDAQLENIFVDNSNQLSNKKPDLQTAFKINPDQIDRQSFVDIDLSDAGGIGGLVGLNDRGVIKNCKFKGNVSGHISQSVGGLVGLNNGLIEDSHFEGNVSGGNASGLVVRNIGTIIDSHATGQFDGMAAYGLSAINQGEIIQSSVTGEIWGGHTTAAFVGTNEGIIDACFAKGYVFGYQRIAGFVAINNSNISDSYSKMTIEHVFSPGYDNKSAAVLVVKNQLNGVIEQSFVAGKIVDSDIESANNAVAVFNEGIITAAYWDTESTGQHEGVGEGSPEGATGLTTQQMTGPAAEQYMPEFDWVNVWRTTEDGYPVLRWQEDE